MSLIQITIDGRVLTYKTPSTPLVKIWLDLMLRNRPGPAPIWTEFLQTNLQTQGSEQRARQTLEKMGLADRDLNDLHLEFQQRTESGAMTREWQLINDLIHQAETAQRSQTACMKFYVDYHTELPAITDSLRPLWAHSAQSGDLCLGYHTIGKTLWHCYQDRDTVVIDQGLLRPQQSVGTEIMLFWGPRDPRTNDQRHRAVKQWLASSGLLPRVDLDDPRHRYHGSPLLARLIDPSPESVLEWLDLDSQITHLQIIPF
jgi:hypothetical protein